MGQVEVQSAELHWAQTRVVWWTEAWFIGLDEDRLRGCMLAFAFADTWLHCVVVEQLASSCARQAGMPAR